MQQFIGIGDFGAYGELTDILIQSDIFWWGSEPSGYGIDSVIGFNHLVDDATFQFFTELFIEPFMGVFLHEVFDQLDIIGRNLGFTRDIELFVEIGFEPAVFVLLDGAGGEMEVTLV